jgi:secretion/DNA translocation related TadE-like protein
VAGILAGAFVLLVAVLALASVLSARHTAQGAADLGSLAAAQAIQRGAGEAEACGEADRVVRDNEAHLASCRIEGEEVVLDVTVPVDLGAFGAREATASARAGPA